MRVGVYGGSFDPPHVAHVLAGAYALSVGDIDALVVVPTYRHAFDKQLTDFSTRVELAERAFSPLAAARVSRIEASLPAPSRTLHLLRALAEAEPSWSMRLVIGSDVLSERSSWHAWDEVVRLAPPLVLGRAGHPHPEAPIALLPELSSTLVRRLLAERVPEVEGLVPRAVLELIRERGLYLAT